MNNPNTQLHVSADPTKSVIHQKENALEDKSVSEMLWFLLGSAKGKQN